MGSRAFAIAEINGRYNQMLRRRDYAALAQCGSFEELIIKLNQHFPAVNEDMAFTAAELRSRLYGAILHELREFSDIALLDYLVDINSIQTFFATLETGTEPLLLGAAEQFKGLAACRTAGEAARLYIRGTRLERHFAGVEFGGRAEDCDLQEAMLRVSKNCLDFYYRGAGGGHMREIMDAEGDRQAMEICLNGRRLRDRLSYFPAAGTLRGRLRDRLAACEGREELATLFCPGAADPLAEALSRVVRAYAEAFRHYGDLSCVYAYFRLREQEMNNILWISECILQGCHAAADDVVVFG